MTNKRKSMNAGDDHAYKLRTYAVCQRSGSRRFNLRSKGFRDAALTSFCVWGPTGIACGLLNLRVGLLENSMKNEEKRRKDIDNPFSLQCCQLCFINYYN